MPPAPTFELTCVYDGKASLGECAQWCVEEQALYWVDINAPSLNCFHPSTGTNVAMPMPASIGCYALRERGGFVVALRDGIWLADARGALGRRVADAPYDPTHHRFNDGRCDRQGRFFAGSMNEKRDANTAALYRLDPDLSLTEVLSDIMISNGLAFSSDGKTMYHADTPTHTIRRFDYDTAHGTPSNPRVLAKFSEETDRPDGGAVDVEGNYWTAFYRGGKVLQISAEGRVLAEHPVPAMCPTMCALGGRDLRTLYVTTARQMRTPDELARLPQSGGIFAMRVAIPGLSEPRFAG